MNHLWINQLNELHSLSRQIISLIQYIDYKWSILFNNLNKNHQRNSVSSVWPSSGHFRHYTLTLGRIDRFFFLLQEHDPRIDSSRIFLNLGNCTYRRDRCRRLRCGRRGGSERRFRWCRSGSGSGRKRERCRWRPTASACTGRYSYQ